MDIGSALVLFFFIFFLLSCCGYCCSSKSKGTVFSTAPVVVTSVTTTAPGPGGYQTNQMTTRSYPTQIYTATFPVNSSQAPYPAHPVGYPPVGVHPNMMPQPQFPTGYNSNPPPYDHVIGQAAGAQMHYPPVQQPVGPYEKPAPYNPNCPPQSY